MKYFVAVEKVVEVGFCSYNYLSFLTNYKPLLEEFTYGSIAESPFLFDSKEEAQEAIKIAKIYDDKPLQHCIVKSYFHIHEKSNIVKSYFQIKN